MNSFHVVAGNPMRYTDKIIIRQKTMNLNRLRNTLSDNKLSDFYIDRI